MKAILPLDVFHCSLEGINLIEASAGTGKTWTICGLYLRLLLERAMTVQQILVVTFTNAATAELRERIRLRIVELAQYLARKPGSSDDPFLAALAGAVIAAMGAERHSGADRQADADGPAGANEQADADGQRVAHQTLIKRLNLALRTFDEASIFTIHGFCQRALADNPFSAGLPMQSELVENDQDLLQEASNDFWRRHVAADSVSPMFASFLNENGDTPEKYAKLLRRHLAKPLARHLWPADIDAPLIDAAVLNQPYQRMRATWLAGKDAVVGLVAASLTSLNGTTYKHAAVQSGAEEWDRICGCDQPLADLGLKTHLFRAGELKKRTKKSRSTPAHDFFTQVEAYLALREQIEASLRLARLRLLRRLFEEAGAQLRDLKRARQVIAFDDMLSNVHERLKNPDFPGLAASIKTRFPAALIDEFQDTDPLQFEIFRTIYGDGDVGGGGGRDDDRDRGDGCGDPRDSERSADRDDDSAHDRGDGCGDDYRGGACDSTVFLVGDPKQAIYSFRHADLHTYLRAKDWATRHWSLAANQRSSRALLVAQNGLFATNPRAFILPNIDYRQVSYGSKRRAEFIDATAARRPLTVWRLPLDAGEPLAKGAAKRAAVEATCAEIARLIDAGARGAISVGGRPLWPRDIAVLVRSRSLGGEVKQALAGLRVGAVEIARSSVFHTPDAEDLDIVLTAILSPARDSLIRAALATDLFGCDAGALETLASSEALLMVRIREFTDYRDLWFTAGFGVMYRRLLAEQGVARRMLSRTDGERRLTNFLHLGESLQQAQETQSAPEALLRHLKTLRGDDNSTDAAQLRLESDQNLVQIVTVHACKGLEYPVVFCPFLCDGSTRFGGAGLEGLEYHDTELRPVIDFREYDPKGDDFADIEATRRAEQAAESVRLLYVALTRAVHRCYLVAGTYRSHKSLKESNCSMLNWLAAGQGLPLASWFGKARTADQIGTASELSAAWEGFACLNPGAVEFSPLPRGAGTAVAGRPTGAALAIAVGSISVSGGWRLSSYSGLNHGARSEPPADDHDARVVPRAVVLHAAGLAAAGIGEDDILRFPRGPSAGECVHAVFEGIDFTDPADWGRAIGVALRDHPQTLPGYSEQAQQQCLQGMLMKLLRDVTEATLIPGLRLDAIPLGRRLTELEFTFPVPHLSMAELNATLESLGYDQPALKPGTLEGYLKGFIDLVFEHQGRFFVLDWKSNHLGYRAADYGTEPLAGAMAEHGYHLQYLIYTVALDRYLRLRLQNYDYEAHFGGVLYLFVRGVRANWTQIDGSTAGVYAHRPSGDAVRRLNQIFDPSIAAAAV
jgi:exodeoxyribonuclease V beta subunit